jgi:hypothetical protein
MEKGELYPELIEYIFSYCGKYFWRNEIKSNKHLHALEKSGEGVNVVVYKFFMKEENVLDNKEIKELISGGFEDFKLKVVKRIWDEHKDELVLNLCPKCGKIARTPGAKQCQFCFYDWH